MVERTSVKVDDEYGIEVVTERLADGWAVVASVKHRSAFGEKTIDLPVDAARYPDPGSARDAGLHQGCDWIAHNVSRAA